MDPREFVESLRGDVDAVRDEAREAAREAAVSDSAMVRTVLEGSGSPAALATAVESSGGGYVLHMRSSYPRLARMVDVMVARAEGRDGSAVDDG